VRGLPPIDSGEAYRIRRWDAVILGSALPGLVAAVRLGMRGVRVLIIEEKAAATAFPGLREPFMMTGSGSTGVLGDCLNALGIPLIDRRRLCGKAPAFQVTSPKARISVGDCIEGGAPDWTAQEIENWGLAPMSVAQDLVTTLREDAETQQQALLSAELFTGSTRLSRVAKRGASEWKTRILSERSQPASDSPASTTSYEKPLATFLDAQVRALSNFAAQPPAAAVRSRLLGSALCGAAEFTDGYIWLRELLEERIRSLYGEFRQISSEFELVRTSEWPAVVLKDPAGICAGRALILNAPLAALRDLMAPDRAPDLLKGPATSHQRLTVHLRGPRRLLPEAMATRVIRIGDPDRPISGTNLIRLRTFGDGRGSDRVDLVASAVVPADADMHSVGEEIEAAVADLLPLGQEGWVRVKLPEARWDRDELLSDPPETRSGSAEASLRPISRLPAYVLDRAQSGALGFEGDLLLGWRAGDAIAAELS
jgi:hypothetical protein